MARRLLVAPVLGVLAMACPVGSAHATTYYNLTHQNADGSPSPSGTNEFTTINGADFLTPSNTFIVGTGVLQPFVRIQPPHNVNCGGSTPCTEAGYNTDGDGGKAQFETKDMEGHNWNHALLLADIGTVVGADGKLYREFILDINEAVGGNHNEEYLSLDKFKLYMAPVGTLDDFNAPDHGGTGADSAENYYFNPLGAATKIYDMDTGAAGGATDNTVGLNYLLNSGSGKGIDLVVRVLDSLFDPALGPYVYLYSSFGELGLNKATGGGNVPAPTLPPGDFGQTAGFEEWSTRVGKSGSVSPAPVPASLLLLGLGLGLLAFTRTLRRRAAPLQA